MSQSRASSLRSSPSATLDSLIRRSCASNCEPNVFAFGSPSTPLARATSIHDGGTHCGLHAQIVFRVWSTFREQKWVTFGECRGDAASQASLQVMSRFLNRLPTVTIREGHRVKVYLTSDLHLPAYRETQAARF